jgi:pimeloyl-ACP methyl ester carboxylesterase
MTPFETSSRYSLGTAFALVAALLLSGCMTYTGPRRAYLHQLTEYLPEPTRPVIVIPGFGSSRLYDPVDRKLVWGLGKNLVHTKYSDDLDLPIDPETDEFVSDRLVPDGEFAGSRAPFNIAYTLSSALQKYGRYVDGQDEPAAPGAVHTFAYDWRLSATTNARRLDAMIDSIRARCPAPAPRVDLVAHSAGGLITLAYLKLGGLGPEASGEQIDLASSLAASKVASVTLVGVPWRGTNEAVRALARGEKLIRREMSTTMMASFPSVPELLPADGRVFIDEDGDPIDLDVWDPATWERLGFAIWKGSPSAGMTVAFERSLDRARRLRDLLDQRPVPQGVRLNVIAGDCVPTAARILLRSDRTLAFYPAELGADERRLGTLMFVPGDGSIEARSAVLEASAGQVFCAGHHGIASDPSVHRALVRILAGGSSDEPAVRTAKRNSPSGSMETENPR